MNKKVAVTEKVLYTIKQGVSIHNCVLGGGVVVMSSTTSVITIGREFGSGGSLIGKELAHYFGIKYYDKELLEHAEYGEDHRSDQRSEF